MNLQILNYLFNQQENKIGNKIKTINMSYSDRHRCMVYYIEFSDKLGNLYSYRVYNVTELYECLNHFGFKVLIENRS